MTTLGHDGAAFTDGSGFPGQPQFKQLIVNGIKSAMGLVPFYEVGPALRTAPSRACVPSR